MVGITSILQQAICEHKAGRLAQARERYQLVLEKQPGHCGALHALGTIAYRQGRYDDAAELICRAIATEPSVAQFHFSLGLTLEALGKRSEAISAYERASALKADHISSYINMAICMQSQGRFTEAAEKCAAGLAAAPQSAELYDTLGCCQQMQGQHAAAIEDHEKALQLAPDFAEAHNHLGIALGALRRDAEATRSFRRAIQLDPDYADAYSNLACALRTQGQLDEAIRNYEQAIRIEPRFAEAYRNLADVLREQGRYMEAIANYELALQQTPDNAEVHNNLAVALQEAGRPDEALKSFKASTRSAPDYAEAHNNLGLLLRSQGLHHEAIRSYTKAIELKPDYANAHWNLSLALLSTGNFAKGWREHQWRRKANLRSILDSQRAEGSTWDGSSFVGKSLLIRYEQGMGDSLQFVRYAPAVKARGGTVIFETLKPLLGLLGTSDGVDQLAEAAPDGEPTIKSDLHVFALDLPRILGTTLKTIPADIPYVYPDRAKVGLWRERLAGPEFKVGVVWAGSPKHSNDCNRSCPLASFAALAGIEGVRLYGLQKGPAAAQADKAASKMEIHNLGEQFGDFADTAAAIENLDLVISVDTAVLHLAGAMGKQVWAILPFVADWRWMVDREDSPWYPTMRLFRQRRPGDWDDVLRRVAQQLRSHMDLHPTPE